MIIPIIVIFIVIDLLFGMVKGVSSSLFGSHREISYEYAEENIDYDEAAFQTYANERYEEVFSASNAYEDNLLIVFLTNEEADGYYTIAWVGDNIRSEINNMFGDEDTEFGSAMMNSINTSYYAYSLDSNLASMMEQMTKEVEGLHLDSSFKSESNNNGRIKSRVINYTDLDITAATVNTALEQFTSQTGIPAVIVVDSMDAVFGGQSDIMGSQKTQKSWLSVPNLIILCLVIVLVIVVISQVAAARKRKKEEDDFTKYNSNTWDQ